MMADKILTFDIDVNSATGEARLRGFGTAARQTAGEAQKADTAIGKGGLSGAFTLFSGVVAAFAAGTAVTKTIDFLRSCVTEASEAEIKIVRLTNSLQRAGIGGTAMTQSLVGLAKELEKTTMLEDDAAIGLMAVGVNLGLTADQARNLVQGAADAAAALGRGPEGIASAVDALATAISSGTTRGLKTFGFNIKEMKFAAGDAKPVIDELMRSFSGAAAAEMETYAGKVNLLTKEWNAFKEEIGTVIIATGALQTSMQMLSRDIGLIKTVFQGFVNLFPTAISESQKFLQQKGYWEEATWLKSIAKEAEDIGQGGYLTAALEQMLKMKVPAEQWNYNLHEIVNVMRQLAGLQSAYTETVNVTAAAEDKWLEKVREHLTSVERIDLLWRKRAGMKEIPFSPFNVDKEFGQREKVSFWETMPEGWAPEEGASQKVFSQFPGEWTDATLAYAKGLKEVGYNMREVIELGADFQANLDMQAAKSQTLADVTNMVTGAMAQFAGQLVYAALMGEQVTGRMLKSMLASIAAEATVKAIFELAEGWAAAANPVTAAEAPLHFMAAKIYGMVAGVAAAASMAFSGKTGTSMGRGYGGRTRSSLAETTTQTPARNIQVTVYLEGKGILVNNTELARELAEEIQRQAGRSGQS